MEPQRAGRETGPVPHYGDTAAWSVTRAAVILARHSRILRVADVQNVKLRPAHKEGQFSNDLHTRGVPMRSVAHDKRPAWVAHVVDPQPASLWLTPLHKVSQAPDHLEISDRPCLDTANATRLERFADVPNLEEALTDDVRQVPYELNRFGVVEESRKQRRLARMSDIEDCNRRFHLRNVGRPAHNLNVGGTVGRIVPAHAHRFSRSGHVQDSQTGLPIRKVGQVTLGRSRRAGDSRGPSSHPERQPAESVPSTRRRYRIS